MVSIIAGEKGQGKTKRLIKLANETLKKTDGHIVFIDDDERHMHDLDRGIRFVTTVDFPLSYYRELLGFVYGIISQNNDITEIFIDGLNNVLKNFDDEVLLKLIKKFETLSEKNKVDIIFTVNAHPKELPEEAKKLLVEEN